ncbi:MAG TPA: hypothetical protein VIJ20_11605, partial [Solirubrobacteraceae bacterium]
ELGRLIALQWAWEELVHDLQRERTALAERIQLTEQRAVQASAAAAREHAERVSVLQAQLDAMRATRAWQIAGRYWRVRNQLAARRGRAARP